MELPVVKVLHRQADRVELRLHVPSDSIYFEGHFPSVAILPGVVQIGWAVELGRRYFPLKRCFHRLEKVKFQRIIRPGEDIVLSLVYTAETDRLGFSYMSERGAAASGRIVFRACEKVEARLE